MAVSIDQKKTGILGVPYLGSFAYASLPAAASWRGYHAFATDLGAYGSMVRSNGTRWVLLTGQQVLKGLGNAVTGIAAVEQIVLQTLLPAGAWQVNDTLRIWQTLTKSGTTDSLAYTVRIGTAGTTADTAVISLVAFLGATFQSHGSIIDIKLATATTAQRVGHIAANNSAYAGGSASAAPAAAAISDASANALYVSVGIKSSGATDTVGAQSAQIQLITP